MWVAVGGLCWWCCGFCGVCTRVDLCWCGYGFCGLVVFVPWVVCVCGVVDFVPWMVYVCGGVVDFVLLV